MNCYYFNRISSLSRFESILQVGSLAEVLGHLTAEGITIALPQQSISVNRVLEVEADSGRIGHVHQNLGAVRVPDELQDRTIDEAFSENNKQITFFGNLLKYLRNLRRLIFSCELHAHLDRVRTLLAIVHFVLLNVFDDLSTVRSFLTIRTVHAYIGTKRHIDLIALEAHLLIETVEVLRQIMANITLLEQHSDEMMSE